LSSFLGGCGVFWGYLFSVLVRDCFFWALGGFLGGVFGVFLWLGVGFFCGWCLGLGGLGWVLLCGVVFGVVCGGCFCWVVVFVGGGFGFGGVWVVWGGVQQPPRIRMTSTDPPSSIKLKLFYSFFINPVSRYYIFLDNKGSFRL